MRFIRDLALATISVLLVLLAVEGILRLTGVRYRASLYTREDERGYAYRPGCQGWNTFENDVYIRFNSHGMRDIERPLRRPAKTLRIAVVGSSEVVGENVRLEDTLPSQLEKQMAPLLAREGWRTEVLNMGGGGYTLTQQYLTLKNHVWQFDPQIVVLAVSPYSIVASTREFRPEADPNTPFLEVRDGNLVSDRITQSRPPLNRRRVEIRDAIANVMNRVTVLALVNAAEFKMSGHIQRFKEFFHPRTQPAEAGRQDSTPGPVALTYMPYHPAVERNWRLTESIFAGMKADCDRHGAEFWIAVLPLPWQMDPRPEVREEFLRSHGLADGDATARRVERFAGANGIRFIYSTPALADYALKHHIALCGGSKTEYANGHPNELGYGLIAETMAKALTSHSAVLRSLNAPGTFERVVHRR